jgi:D-glycero-alpha-D-manno-heptose 1-phosphate guanylyltransferase
METIILAGGMGTRLQEVVSDLPKPMAPVSGKPFLHYLFLWLEKYKIEKVIISAGYKSEAIVGYFGDSFNKISVGYAIEEKPLGTGGAIKYALQKTTDNEILIVNGDTYFPISLDKFRSFHSKNRSIFSIALKRMKNFSRYGSVECEGNKILKFNEKNFCKEGLINGGIYIASRNIFESVRFPEIFSLEKNFLEKEAGTGKLKCQVFYDSFIDIGIPEDYMRAQTFLNTSL